MFTGVTRKITKAILKITQDVHWGAKGNYLRITLVIFFVTPVNFFSNFKNYFSNAIVE